MIALRLSASSVATLRVLRATVSCFTDIRAESNHQPSVQNLTTSHPDPSTVVFNTFVWMQNFYLDSDNRHPAIEFEIFKHTYQSF